MNTLEILEEVQKLGLNLVEITGGEPLAQDGVNFLLSQLCDRGFKVLIETNGAFPISELDERVRVIMDVKCPGSGMSERICWDNFSQLEFDKHELKFVITSKEDFDWAAGIVRSLGLVGRANLLISPVAKEVALPDLARWIMGSRLPLRLQVQLHKIIWNTPGIYQ
jgi:7-carboxy-7-deazaguanine synthase